MIWLASYPRSGSTFLRIVLEQVYGVRSSTFHEESVYALDEDYASYPVVKTHLLPHQLVPADPGIPAVYLLRDGRDCVVSLAHYRRGLIDPDSNYGTNLRAAIDAANGSHFGGWSEHVRCWLGRAALVIRFEELISEPIATCERLRPWLELPEPRVDALPSFSDLRARPFPYGSGASHGFDEARQAHFRTAKFRRGRIGSWKDELPEPAHLRFLLLHGRTLSHSGYAERGVVERARAGNAPAPLPRSTPTRRESGRRTIVVDATKLLDPTLDGIRRYTEGLLTGLIGTARECAADFRLVAQLHRLQCNLLEIDDFAAIQQLVEAATRPHWGQRSCGRPALAGRVLRRVHRTVRRVAGRILPATSPPDLLHLLLPNTWSAYQGVRAPRITTVHDCSHLRCPELQTDINNGTLRSGLAAAIREDSDYLAVSRSSRNDLVELCGVAPARVTVTYPGCDAGRFRPDPPPEEIQRVSAAYDLPTIPYLLALSTFEPRKNLVRLVRGFKRFIAENPQVEIALVLAGSPGWGDQDALNREVQSCPRIKRLGRVEECDLPTLYASAHAFCYVSVYEGFGLPALEAMCSGLPVIFGRGTAVEEVVGATGLSADPKDEADIAWRIRQIATDPDLRRDLARAAVLRSSNFTWRSMASSTLDAYDRSLSQGAAARFATRRGSRLEPPGQQRRRDWPRRTTGRV